jgi:hypothetical protein
MEDNPNAALATLTRSRFSGTWKPVGSLMEPLLSLQIADPRRIYQPGDELEWECQIDAVDPKEIQAVETSVLWYTEGKGDEDLGVHYFNRRVPSDSETGDLRPMHRFTTILPNSPLSYSGKIVKVRWCARVRLFLKNWGGGVSVLWRYHRRKAR